MDAVVRAPEIDRPGIEWHNVAQPLSLKVLRGRLVILDFWTFSCINCLHLLPTLRRVEEAFPEEVVVIGVHSPKHAAEKDGRNLAQAIARYGIRHAVAHDPGFRLWRDYAIRAWPTLVFVSPDGRVVGQHAGEPDPEQLLKVVGDAVERFRGAGALAPALLRLNAPEALAGRFSFPAKLKPMPNGDGARQWALADAGHHQIVGLDDGGRELGRVGSGAPGFADGPAGEAQFNGPQGLIAGEDAEGWAIYVADTGNHAIRRVALVDGSVTTLAGTGRRGSVLGSPEPALEKSLASVWDLEFAGGALLFANAGSHQLGRLELARRTVQMLAGSGHENIVDGPAIGAQLAQPSGLALDPAGAMLYFADSETSAVRALDLAGRPTVTTLVGAGLFEFGHVNGPFDEARLQHALGLAWLGGGNRLVVADSYNDALRVLDLDRREAGDLDDGFLCEDPVCLPAHEPAGVAADGPDRILMVDTNNHRILEYRATARRYRSWAG